jgi:hypothetical protein
MCTSCGCKDKQREINGFNKNREPCQGVYPVIQQASKITLPSSAGCKGLEGTERVKEWVGDATACNRPIKGSSVLRSQSVDLLLTLRAEVPALSLYEQK